MSGGATRPVVLVTGAAGALGRVLCDSLPTLGWTVRGLDIAPPPLPADRSFLGSTEDAELVRLAADGADAIVHLGGVANPGFAWRSYLDVNIGGTWSVLESARAVGVRRVVLASSNHAAGYVPRRPDLPGSVASRADSLYGVSKAAMESLGAFYADEYGLETISLRIGSCQPKPDSIRSLSSWLSYPDFARLVVAAVTGPWSGYASVWGVSNNTRRWWSLAEGERMGYHPEDDAERYADELTAPGVDAPYVGGARPPYPADNDHDDDHDHDRNGSA